MRWTIISFWCHVLLADESLLRALTEARAALPSTAAKILPSVHPREIVLLGTGVIECSLDEYTHGIREISTFRQGPDVLGVGEIGSSDWSRRVWTEPELKRLRNCQTGDCPFRLPQPTIERLAREVDWSTTDALARTRGILAGTLEAISRDYQRNGLGSNLIYHDKPSPLNAAHQSRELLAASSSLLGPVPELARYLDQYPKTALPGAEDSLYWSVDKIGSTPVVSLTHRVIYQKGPSLWIASRQIFANHYLDGGLSITHVAEDPQHPGRLWVEYVNRSRTALLEGPLARLRRYLIGESARKAAINYMDLVAHRMRTTKRGG